MVQLTTAGDNKKSVHRSYYILMGEAHSSHFKAKEPALSPDK